MPRIVAEPIEWFRVLWRDQAWPLVFTAPRFCRYYDGSWCGLTVWEDRAIYLDPRPSAHPRGIDETVIHELMHVTRGPFVDLRSDEPLVATMSEGLHSILGPYRPQLPPLPNGIERLQRMCARYRKHEDE